MSNDQPQYITPPAGTFFRVFPPDKKGEMLVALMRRQPSKKWFKRTEDVILHSRKLNSFEVRHNVELYLKRTMMVLIRAFGQAEVARSYEAKLGQTINGLVGEYPPKRMPAL